MGNSRRSKRGTLPDCLMLYVSNAGKSGRELFALADVSDDDNFGDKEEK